MIKNLDQMNYFKNKLKYQSWQGDAQNLNIPTNIDWQICSKCYFQMVLKFLLVSFVKNFTFQTLKDLVIPVIKHCQRIRKSEHLLIKLFRLS